MTAFTLTTGVNNFTGAGDPDTFSGAGGGYDKLDGGAGSDTFIIDGNQAGIINGRVGSDTVRLFGNKFDPNLTFSLVENLHVMQGSLRAAVTQLSKWGAIVPEAPGTEFHVYLQGAGGTLNFFSYTSLKILHVDASTLTGQVDLVGSSVGADILTGSTFDDTLNGFGGDDRIFGGLGNDTIDGSTGNDVLFGGVGDDTMRGSFGDDTYYIDSSGDLVEDSLGSLGSDTVRSANLSINLNYSTKFRGNVEHAVAEGYGNLNLTGNALYNDLRGNAANNVIDGGGNGDRLTGGGGNDIFRFTTGLGPGNIDTITDYDPARDRIELDNAAFSSLLEGWLYGSYFRANTTGLAQDASDRIIYETDTGKLFYDSNGTAAGGTYQQFATLSAGLGMSAAEFFVT